jgi:hypothetical protein
MVFLGIVPPEGIGEAVNWDTIILLFGMMLMYDFIFLFLISFNFPFPCPLPFFSPPFPRSLSVTIPFTFLLFSFSPFLLFPCFPLIFPFPCLCLSFPVFFLFPFHFYFIHFNFRFLDIRSLFLEKNNIWGIAGKMLLHKCTSPFVFLGILCILYILLFIF